MPRQIFNVFLPLTYSFVMVYFFPNCEAVQSIPEVERPNLRAAFLDCVGDKTWSFPTFIPSPELKFLGNSFFESKSYHVFSHLSS